MNFRSELEAEPWRFDLLSVLRRLERELDLSEARMSIS